VDRRLSETEMHQLRLYSTRARITATSFINEYNWGDFKGDPDAWMEKYFDGYLYFANWGTRVLQLALPEKLLPEQTASLYCATDAASVRRASGKLILRFILEQEDTYEDDLLEGDGGLSSLLPLRNDIASGDLRCLYLGWLMSVQHYQVHDDAVEPPLPPDMGKLSGVLSDFADFLHIDRDLISVAAEASPLTKNQKPTGKEMAAWVSSLPGAEKDRMLAELVSGDDPHVGANLRARFSRDRNANNCIAAPGRRKAAELRAAAGERGKKDGRNRRRS
jgi:hypothetical protein